MIKIKKYQIEDYISDATQDALDLKADLVNGKVPASQLPSFVDDVIEVANYAALPIPGATGVIYITLDTNKVYRWTGSVYVEIASGVTNLSYTPGVSNGTVNSDTGSDAIIPLAGTVNAGLFSAAEKAKLDSLELQNLQEVVNIGNSISNYGGIGTATIQSTNFSNNRTLYLNNNSHPTIKLEDNLDGNHYTVIDIDTLNLSGVSYPWSSIVGGSQNLQEVTDEGATTDNTITINTINANGLNINTSGTNSSKSPMVITSTVSDGTAFSCYSYNGSLGSYIYSDSGDCLVLQNDFSNGLGLNISSTGAGISAYSINLPVVELYQALTNKGLVINSGTSSTGNFIELAKNSVNKLVVNQAGELTAQKLIKDGGTSSQILAADGSVITAGTNITITGGTISSVGGTGGGGSSVNYYLNGGTSQGTFGGVTYYEFSKTAVIGTGADFSRGSNGLIASFITDVADPSLLLIPGGNWNLEFFFSSSSAGGSPSFYVELYKYDGTTFTLITSNSTNPEGITGGTSIDAYFTPLAVPETVLTVNDRLAIRVFVNASSKTITLHTQNGHLCEVITTFTSGLTALNGLQAQVQNFATGTTGTDFAIVSSGSTHTFNLPDAGVGARGVVTTGSQTFAGDKNFTGTVDINLSANAFKATSVQGMALEAVGGNNGTPIGKFTRQSDLVEIARFDNSGLKLQLETASTIASFDANKNVVSLTAANGYPTLAELKWLAGTTSSIQTQFSGKQATLSGTGFVKSTAGTISYDTNTYLTSAVTTLSGGTTGLTPSTDTSGAVTLAGTLNILNGGTGATTAPQARINLGGSTLGINIFTAFSPSAITFLRVNADNTPSYLDAPSFRTAIGIGTVVTSLSTIGTAATANTNGATITGSVLNLEPASASFGGVVTTGVQTIAGVKTFNSSPLAPTPAIGVSNTTVATTQFVTNSINAATPGTGYGVFNILISPTGNITTQEPGASGGGSYSQNGRNVMINNGATVINIDATNAVDGFIASYTKIGSAAITFTATSPVVFVNAVNGVTLNGDPNSTALLVKNGNNIYLSINNLL